MMLNVILRLKEYSELLKFRLFERAKLKFALFFVDICFCLNYYSVLNEGYYCVSKKYFHRGKGYEEEKWHFKK